MDILTPAKLAEFWRRTDKTATCWLWRGCLIPKGYGQINIDGKMRLVHRISYMLHKGDIPPGMHVCHICDVRNCVNPDHLWLGTNAENAADRKTKGRYATGEQHHAAKLSESDVRTIRNLYAAGSSSQAIARQFGVNWSTAKRIVTRRSWRNII